ncbi:MAG: cytochrome c [Acidobacteria bacterium]|nr:cytochrome c [Acidobacteriota bacterium]
MLRVKLSIFCIFCGLFLFNACRQDMADQPSYRPLQPSNFFADGQASRPLVQGTVARGQLRDDVHLYTGKKEGQLVTTFPFTVDKTVVKRGQERFNIYCAPCHGQTGSGNGMIVQRGFKKAASYYDKEVREKSVGHYFDVITNGFGAMAGYSAQVNVRDRWAIIAYIRALQESQSGNVEPLPIETMTDFAPSGVVDPKKQNPLSGSTPKVEKKTEEKSESGGH